MGRSIFAPVWFRGREDADMGACCPHTRCPEDKDASRRECNCWGRNRLLFSPSRGFRPQLPPLPRQGTPPVAGLESRLFLNLIAVFGERERSACCIKTRQKHEKFEDSILDFTDS